MILFKEVISGVTYSRMSDGTYDPPLPPEEIEKRRSRDSMFKRELRERKVAGGQTDDTFFGGMPHFADVMGADYAKEVYAEWDRQGIPYTAQTNYNPFLAEYRGDPRAKVEGRSTLKRRKEWLDQQPLVDPMENAPRLADNLIYECAEHFAKEHPDEAAKMTTQDMRAHMIEKHARKK